MVSQNTQDAFEAIKRKHGLIDSAITDQLEEAWANGRPIQLPPTAEEAAAARAEAERNRKPKDPRSAIKRQIAKRQERAAMPGDSDAGPQTEAGQKKASVIVGAPGGMMGIFSGMGPQYGLKWPKSDKKDGEPSLLKRLGTGFLNKLKSATSLASNILPGILTGAAVTAGFKWAATGLAVAAGVSNTGTIAAAATAGGLAGVFNEAARDYRAARAELNLSRREAFRSLATADNAKKYSKRFVFNAGSGMATAFGLIGLDDVLDNTQWGQNVKEGVSSLWDKLTGGVTPAPVAPVKPAAELADPGHTAGEKPTVVFDVPATFDGPIPDPREDVIPLENPTREEIEILQSTPESYEPAPDEPSATTPPQATAEPVAPPAAPLDRLSQRLGELGIESKKIDTALQMASEGKSEALRAQGTKDLAFMLLNGREGLPRTDEMKALAVSLYEQAAEAGNKQAIQDLAYIEYHGLGGVAADPEKAVASLREITSAEDNALLCAHEGNQWKQGVCLEPAEIRLADAKSLLAAQGVDIRACEFNTLADGGIRAECGEHATPEDALRSKGVTPENCKIEKTADGAGYRAVCDEQPQLSQLDI